MIASPLGHEIPGAKFCGFDRWRSYRSKAAGCLSGTQPGRQPEFKDPILRDTQLHIAGIIQARTPKLAIHSRLWVLKITPLIHRPALLNP